MTSPLTTPAEPPLPGARVCLTATDAERIATAVEAEIAASTRETYACSWRQWERWCSGRGIQPLPAQPEAVAAFLAERAEAGVHVSTLDCYCSGIAHRHRQEGMADPTADFLVGRVRRGLRRILGVVPIRQAHPLTVAELGWIVASIDTDDAKEIRDRAILLLGYGSAMRPGEISAFNVEDLQRKPTGVLIIIRRSKTDPDAQGNLIGVARGDNRLTDPIRALGVSRGPPVRTGCALHTRPVEEPPHQRTDRTARDQRDRVRTSQRGRLRRYAGLGPLPPRRTRRHRRRHRRRERGPRIDRIAAQTRHRDLGNLLNQYIRPAEAMATTTSRDLGL